MQINSKLDAALIKEINKTKLKPAAVVVVAVGDCLCSDSQMIVVVDVGPVLQEQLDYVSVSPPGRHSKDTRPQPVSSIYLRPILQQHVGNSQVSKPDKTRQKKTE